jgi:hypothetical protein
MRTTVLGEVGPGESGVHSFGAMSLNSAVATSYGYLRSAALLAVMGGACGRITPLGIGDAGAGHEGGAAGAAGAGTGGTSGGGSSGASGSAGGSGSAGTTGSVGASGASGAAGTTGSAGASGSSGSAGGSGSAGRTGSAGTAGSAGTIGGGGSTGSAGAAGGGGATGTCAGLDQSHCGLRSGCFVKSCPVNGISLFVGCYRPGTDIEPSCTCVVLSEADCRVRPSCRVDACPGCDGGSTYVGCSMLGAGPVACALGCPGIPLTCAQVTTATECEARNDCHSVFVDNHNCACAALGCCARFNRCADGDKAMCAGTPLCKSVSPYCEGPFVVAYTATCYEGCVQKKDCAP